MKYKLLSFLLLIGVFVMAHDKPYRLYNTHHGLPQIQVTGIHQDAHGYIWVGTKGGLAQFNGEHFHQYLHKEHIYSIKSDAMGNVFVRSSSGFYKYDGASFECIKNRREPFNYIVARDHFFLYCKEWIEHYKGDSIYNTYKVGIDFPVGGIKNIAFDTHEEILYCTDYISNEVYRINQDKLTKIYESPVGWQVNVAQLNADHPVIILYNQKEVRYLSMPNGELLFSFLYANHHIQQIEVEHLPVNNYLLNYMYDYYRLDSASLSSQKVELDHIKGPSSVLFDRDDQLWIGADAGLYQIWNKPFTVYPESFLYDFWTLIESDQGYLYGGAFKQGLYHLDMDKEVKTEIFAQGPFDSKETDYYYGASKDNTGKLYFPTHYGLVIYNEHQTKKLDTGISLITKYDPYSKRIIFGQENGFAFINESEEIDYIKDISRSKIKSHPVSFEFSDDSLIWIGSGKSLAVYNRYTESLDKVSALFDQYPKGGIVAMSQDSRHNIWMGGREGLWYYNASNRSFKSIDIQCAGNITSLMAISDDYLLIGTSRELLVLRFKDFLDSGQLIVKTYNYRNGLLAQEIAQNGFVHWRNHILFPSSTNVTAINLDEVKFKSESFGVEITHCNKKEVAYQHRKAGQAILMDDFENDLEFEFETVGYGLPTLPEYSYRLLGYKKEWSDWANQSYAAFNNLSSGEYEFEVRVKPSYVCGLDDFQVSSLIVQVALPFYREPYFYKFAFFALLLLSLIIAYIARSRYMFKLKAISQERKKRYLEVASLQANLNPHFIFNLLASVQNLITLHKPEVANQYLIKFSRLIRAYMEATIKSSNVVNSADSSNEIALKEELDLLRMYIEFEQVKYRGKGFKYSIEVADSDLLNKTIPPMIIQPFIENAIKHGLHPLEAEGILSVRFYSKNEHLVCLITDNGIGRAASQEMKKESISAYESRGIALINQRIAILNELGYSIQIEFEDPEYGGTIVKILFKH